MEAIRFNGVTKVFGKTTALDQLSLEVSQGQICGFLGPNGAGKTTAIRSLMDFIKPDTGTIIIFGQDAHQNSVELKKDIGYAPADSFLNQDWTGWQHLKFVSGLRQIKKPDLDLVKKLGFDPKIKIKNLSTGNKQKLNIILALFGNPKLLILDEPTQGLDPILQNEFYTLLGDYKNNGGTVFMSSHNLHEVERVCDGIAIINRGKIVSEETINSLKEKNLHRISVVLDKDLPDEIAKDPQVKIISQSHRSIVLTVKGDLNPILKKLVGQNIKNIEITNAGLEEIFMEHYQNV